MLLGIRIILSRDYINSDRTVRFTFNNLLYTHSIDVLNFNSDILNVLDTIEYMYDIEMFLCFFNKTKKRSCTMSEISDIVEDIINEKHIQKHIKLKVFIPQKKSVLYSFTAQDIINLYMKDRPETFYTFKKKRMFLDCFKYLKRPPIRKYIRLHS